MDQSPVAERQATVSKAELLLDGSDAAFRQMVHDLLAFSARLEEVRSRFGSYIGLTGIQYTILISVRYLEGREGVGVRAVADHLTLSGAFVTIETTKLVKLGLLEKRPNTQDRRRVLLNVSPRGRDLLDQLAPVQREINDVLFESLDARSFASIASMATRMKVDADKALLLADYLIEKSGGR